MALRDFIKAISPATLQDGVAERYLYNIGLGGDGAIDKSGQAMRASLPKKCDASALPYIGADLLIPRGLTETDDSYRDRLSKAVDDWHHAGSPWAVLRQSLATLLALAPAARTVSSTYTNVGALTRSVWNTYNSSADTSKPPTYALAANWDWDSVSATTGSWGWWRWWPIFYQRAPQNWCDAAPFKFGTAGVKIGQRPDASIGLNIPSSVITTIRSVIKLWQREGSWCHEIIVSLDDTLFDPAQPVGGGINPDGTFGRWSKVVSGQYVPSRFASARYCTGVTS